MKPLGLLRMNEVSSPREMLCTGKSEAFLAACGLDFIARSIFAKCLAK
jgi:hypothetical protein